MVWGPACLGSPGARSPVRLARWIKNRIYDWRAASDRAESVRILRRMEYLLPDPVTRFAIPWTFTGKGHCKHLTAYQHPTELLRLYRRLLDVKPVRVVEIGTARGGTLYLWTQASAASARIVSVDLPSGPFGGGYRACRGPFYEAFPGPQQDLTLIRDNAHDATVRDRVAAAFGAEGVDFLFIDADHSLRGIRRSLLCYGPLVREGGLIALHDILENPRWPEIEIWKLWRHLRDLGGAEEITDSLQSHRPLGIGLIHIGARGFQPVRDVIERSCTADPPPRVSADSSASQAEGTPGSASRS